MSEIRNRSGLTPSPDFTNVNLLVLNRYQRHLNLPGFGPEGQQRLLNAAVLVVGAGGLGVPVLQYLCAMGVGRLGIVDGDHVQLGNLQRQVLYRMADIGALKAECAAAQLRQLNPDIKIDVVPQMLDTENALPLIAGYDLVIDATDAFSARYLINDACVILGKPWVFGAVHQYEGQLGVFNFNGGPTYRCLFPNQPRAEEIPDCDLGGVLGVIPGIVGSRQALEAVKILCGIGNSLSGVVLTMDFLHDTEYRMRLKPVVGNLRISSLQESYESSCGPVPGISPEAFRREAFNERAALWDVRSVAEFDSGHLKNAVSVPMEMLAGMAGNLDTSRPLYVYCQRGSRSLRAAQELMALRPGLQVFSIEGGIDACPGELYAL